MLTREQFQPIYEQGADAVYNVIATLQATVTTQQEQIATQQEQMALLTRRVTQLEAQLKQDSHNSSKPPSSDPPAHKPKSLRKSSGRKAGGQPGHPGRTLPLVDIPDVVVLHTPPCCTGCGADLSATPASHIERRQVSDLPPLTLVVTQHRGQHKVCADCGHVTPASFPAGVSQPVQYGPRMQALGPYLRGYQLLPVHRACELLSDVFGAGMCPASLFVAAQSGHCFTPRL